MSALSPKNLTREAIAPDSRIIFMTEGSQLGGAERSCLALANWLHAQGIPAHFLIYEDPANLSRFADHPLPVVALNPAPRAFSKISSLRRYLRSLRPSPFQLLASGYQPALHATLAGDRSFHTLMHDTPSLFSDAGEHHSLSSHLRRWASNRLVAQGLRSGGSTIVTSEFLQKDTLRIFGVQAAIARMGGMASGSRFRPRPVTSELRMLSVSRVESNKRIDWMLRALASLEKKTPTLSSELDWQLDIAGKGSQLDALSLMAKQLGIANRVHFHGFVSDADLSQLYDRAHLFLMPALQGYGIPATEAIYRGIPVLLHRESGVSDILLDTPWATVIHGDEASLLPGLATAIQSLRAGTALNVPPPPIPTEADWAEQVARLCHWI